MGFIERDAITFRGSRSPESAFGHVQQRRLLRCGRCNGVGVAVAYGLAGDGFQIFAEAECDGGQIAIVASDGNAFAGHSRVRVGEELLNVTGTLRLRTCGADE